METSFIKRADKITLVVPGRLSSITHTHWKKKKKKKEMKRKLRITGDQLTACPTYTRKKPKYVEVDKKQKEDA